MTTGLLSALEAQVMKVFGVFLDKGFLIVKNLFILILIVSSLSSNADSKISFLTNDELESLSNTPENENVKVDMVRKSVLEANIYDGEIVDYYYDCKNLKGIEPKSFFASSESVIQFSGVSDEFDWGIVAEVSCNSKLHFNDSSIQDLWLQSCAQGVVLSLVSNMQERLNTKIKIDYSQWCILNYRESEITIKQVVKFK